jgi:hypothetical protein
MIGVSSKQMVPTVMTELRTFLDAVERFETTVADWFGIARSDLRWFELLLKCEEGATRAQLERATTLAPEELDERLGRLQQAGHVRVAHNRVMLAPAARDLLIGVYASIDRAYVGMYRYGAREQAVIRTFLRIGREFYERQLRQLDRAAKAP